MTLLLSGWEPRKATCLERTEAIGEGDRLNLKQFLAAVRRYWVTFVLVTAAVSAFGLTWILLSPAKFVSSTQLMVSIAGSTTAAAYQNDEVVAGRINSYIPLLTSGVVAQRVIDTLGLPLTASELAAKINATRVPPRTAIIDVAVTDESPARAQLIAQTVAREFISYTEALETPTGEDSQKVHTTVVTAASEAHENRAERVLLASARRTRRPVGGSGRSLDPSRDRSCRPKRRPSHRRRGRAGTRLRHCGIGSLSRRPSRIPSRRTQLQSMTDRTGDASNRGAVLMLTSTVGEVETVLQVASNLGRASRPPLDSSACRRPGSRGCHRSAARPKGVGQRTQSGWRRRHAGAREQQDQCP